MDNQSLLGLIYSAHRRLAEMESAPKDYGLGELLYPSDIHTVVGVANQEGCNLTELATILGISLPATFKSSGKMVKLGYLDKQRRKGNAKEVVFFLSAKGRLAVKNHQAFQQKAFGSLMEIENRLSPPHQEIIRNFLVDLREAMA
jgi:DNA-binding MarR family transcriptional regulator